MADKIEHYDSVVENIITTEQSIDVQVEDWYISSHRPDDSENLDYTVMIVDSRGTHYPVISVADTTRKMIYYTSGIPDNSNSRRHSLDKQFANVICDAVYNFDEYMAYLHDECSDKYDVDVRPYMPPIPSSMTKEEESVVEEVIDTLYYCLNNNVHVSSELNIFLLHAMRVTGELEKHMIDIDEYEQ